MIILFDPAVEWNIQRKTTIHLIMLDVGQCLSKYTDLPAEESVHLYFGDIRFRVKWGLRDRYGIPCSAFCQWNIIYLRPESFVLPYLSKLIKHELGHLLDQHRLKGEITKALRRESLPFYWLTPPFNGFGSDAIPHRMKPRHKDPDRFELWPDMLMSTIDNCFTATEAGKWMYLWTDNYLKAISKRFSIQEK